MKYLLVILLILVVFWLWQYERRAQKNASAAPPRPSVKPAQTEDVTEIVACSVCQVHLPRAEALTGRTGRLYCSEAHRREAGG